MRRCRRPARRLLANEQGMALLLTVAVISLLITMTVQFGRTMRHGYFASATLRDGQQLVIAARSGLNIGLALLEADGKISEYDSLQEEWATLTEDSFAERFPRGLLNLRLTDLGGRLQINSLVATADGQGDNQNANDNRELLKRLLLSGRFQIEDEQQALAIVDSLVDWLDEDDRESDFGAEDSYYRSLTPAYGCANGPVHAIEELLLVRHITAELLFGTALEPGLAAYVTVHGNDGKLNINTAPPPLLEALHPLLTAELAESMAEYRLDPENSERLAEPDWYRLVPGWPGDIELPEPLLTTAGGFFQVLATGSFHDQRRQLTAVVARDADKGVWVVERRME